MKIKQVTNKLLKLYPLPLQEEWDESGYLNKGKLDKEITKCFVCLDLTHKVIDEAIKQKANLVISHHPIFQGNEDHPMLKIYANLIKKIKKANITVLSLHTCFDNSEQGMNFIIANRLGLKNIRWYKGKKENQFVEGTFTKSLTAKEIANKFKSNFDIGYIATNVKPSDTFKKLVICGGAGLSLFTPKYEAISKEKALIITGDIKHHGWQDLYQYNVSAMDVGHVLENVFVDFIPALINHEIGKVDCFAITTKRKDHTI